jgi:hypothetical protein
MEQLRVFLDRTYIDDAVPVASREAEQVGVFLETERAFPRGYWHPEDFEALKGVVRGCLDDMGVGADAVPDILLRAVIDDFAAERDEVVARRHQIGALAMHVNEVLAARESPYRLYAFARDLPGWESQEPVWLLLSADERKALMRMDVIHPPEEIEQLYDLR